MKISFSQQRLRSNPVEIIRAQLQRSDKPVSGAQLLSVVEETISSTLPSDLRALFTSFSAPALKARRGRPRNDPAKEDFALEELDRKYCQLLREFRESGTTDADRPASERAYRQLAGEMACDFGPIDWLALRNKHSAWRNGHCHPTECHVDSEDFDAEIERQFPAHNNDPISNE